MKVISGTANKPLAEAIAHKLHVALTPLEVHLFPDGERRIRVREKVLDEDTVIVQPTNPPVDTNVMELLFLIDALKRNGARSVTVVVPYLAYQRQDHLFREGEAVSLAVVVRSIETAGAGKCIVVDPHTIKLPEMFHIVVSDLSALSLFAEKIRNEGWNTSDTVLVSPDMGGVRRIKILSDILNGLPYAAVEKNRDLTTGRISAEVIHGELRRRAVIVDDMISTGKTIAQAAQLLKTRGVEECVVFATHPVFSDEAPQILEDAPVGTVFVTDTIDIPDHKRFTKLAILSVADIIAKEIMPND